MQTSRLLAVTIRLGLVLVAMPAFAASDYLLEIDGVKGESAAPGTLQSVEVSSWSWGASNPSTVGPGSSAGAGKVAVQDLSVSAGVKSPRDAASGQASGKRMATADIDADGRADVVAAPTVGSTAQMTVRLRESPTRASTTRTMCAQGKHFPKVSLTGNGQRYELQDVAVTSCDVQRDETRIVLSGKVTHTKTGHVTLLK